jgi:hypothetical protein
MKKVNYFFISTFALALALELCLQSWWNRKLQYGKRRNESEWKVGIINCFQIEKHEDEQSPESWAEDEFKTTLTW